MRFVCLRDTFYNRYSRLFREGEIVFFSHDPTDEGPDGEPPECKHFKRLPGGEEPPVEVETIDWASLTKAQLVEHAESVGIEYADKMKKSELVTVIEAMEQSE